MAQPTPIFVGLNVHKDSITVAHARRVRRSPVFVGAIGTPQANLNRLIRRLQAKTSNLMFAYEAGPRGYGLHRYLDLLRNEFVLILVRPSIDDFLHVCITDAGKRAQVGFGNHVEINERRLRCGGLRRGERSSRLRSCLPVSWFERRGCSEQTASLQSQ